MVSRPSALTTARVVLGLEDKRDKPVPEWFIYLFDKFLFRQPHDTHFIVELGEEGKEVGGNGFGSITCMEDYCWEDIVLDADPEQPIAEQRVHGFGSFFNYVMHCQKPNHIKGRNERCAKEGITVTASTGDPLQAIQTPARAPPPTSAGPSRLPASRLAGPTRASEHHPQHSSYAQTHSLTFPAQTLGQAIHTGASQSAVPARASQGSTSSASASQSRSSPLALSSNSRRRDGTLLDYLDDLGPAQSKPVQAAHRPRSAASGSIRKSGSSQTVLQPLSINVHNSSTTHRQPSSSGTGQPSDPAVKIETEERKALRETLQNIIAACDDEIAELEGDDIPPDMRRRTNRDNPIMIVDADSDDDRGVIAVPRYPPPHRSQSSSSRPTVPEAPPVAPPAVRTSSSSSSQRTVSRAPSNLTVRLASDNKKQYVIEHDCLRRYKKRGVQPAILREFNVRYAMLDAFKNAPGQVYHRPADVLLEAMPTLRIKVDHYERTGSPMTKEEYYDYVSKEIPIPTLPQPSSTATASTSSTAGPSASTVAAASSTVTAKPVVPATAASLPVRPPIAPPAPVVPGSSSHTVPRLQDQNQPYRAVLDPPMPGAFPSDVSTGLKSLNPALGTLLRDLPGPFAAPLAGPSTSGSARISAAVRSYNDMLNEMTDVESRATIDGLNTWGSMPGSSTSAYTYPPAPALPGSMALHDMRMGQVAAATHPIDPMYAMEDEFDRPANIQEFFQDSLNSFTADEDIDGALDYLGLKSTSDKFADLNITLMPHQLIGVKFMLQQERNPKMKGGILADAMGLGKTVQCLATIVGNPSKDKKVKTTLIVGPLALLQQWKREIETKTNDKRKIVTHWGAQRSKSTQPLRNADVVLTTYGTLAAEFGLDPKKMKKKKPVSAANDDDSEDELMPVRAKGPLFKMRFYRVVLDEAHYIRNRLTKGAQACWDLNAEYRWALSGTIFVNRLADLFPLLRFLMISPNREWKHFNSYIARIENSRPKTAVKRCQVVLKTCSLRRHKESELNGVRLLTLPEKITTMENLVFSKEERDTYDQVEHRMQVRFSRFLKAGSVLKRYHQILVMLMRLRQVCLHPYLLRRRAHDAAHPDDVIVTDDVLGITIQDASSSENDAELARAVASVGQEYVDKVKRLLAERHEDVLLATRNKEDNPQMEECCVCLDGFASGHEERITECLHSMCNECCDLLFSAPNTNTNIDDLSDEDVAKNVRSCPICRGKIQRDKVFRASAFWQPAEDEDDGEDGPEGAIVKMDPSPKRKSISPADHVDVKPAVKKLKDVKGKGKAVAVNVDVDELEDNADLENVTIIPSTKMRKLAELLQGYLAESADTKIIVFSTFVEFINLCVTYLDQRGVQSMRYVGSMRPAEREATLDTFNRDNEGKAGSRILFISLKAGGVGLNLVRANIVINLDFAWNAASEEQAVDRVHRIGQARKVDVRRLIVENTIEGRICALQEKKKALAEGAMGEGQAGKLGRLSLGDLIQLFNVGEKED